MPEEFFFELGIILIIAFFSALLIKKTGQSVIVGYIIAGLIIGPFGIGIVKNTYALEYFSELGISLLMFFLGIEFSINKFKKVKNSVLFIGTYEVLLNLIAGYILGNIIGIFAGFTEKEKIFFACIIALSSSGVVGKLLVEMKRTASKESEILMGIMIYEDFLAVIILGILSSLTNSDTVNMAGLMFLSVKAIVFYGIFILAGIFIINKLIDFLAKIESQELFTLLMLGMILLIGALASYIGLSAPAGAFLLGMIITSYDVEKRLHRTIAGFRDVFLTIFFIAFGMLMDIRDIPDVLLIAAAVIPVSIIFEIMITSSGAFFSGIASDKAFRIGTSMVARGEYSLIYASIGLASGIINNNLYQFTGVYVFIMTLTAPVAMRNSDKIKNIFSMIIPGFVKFAGNLLAVTLKPILMHEELGIIRKRNFKMTALFFSYIIISILIYSSASIWILIPLTFAGVILLITIYKLVRTAIKNNEEYIELSIKGYKKISANKHIDFISKGFFAMLLSIIIYAFLCKLYPVYITLIPLILFVIYICVSSFILHMKHKIAAN